MNRYRATWLHMRMTRTCIAWEEYAQVSHRIYYHDFTTEMTPLCSA